VVFVSFSRVDIGQLGRLEPNLRISRQGDVKRIAEKIRGEFGPVAEQNE
jgi:hypothetical protein